MAYDMYVYAGNGNSRMCIKKFPNAVNLDTKKDKVDDLFSEVKKADKKLFKDLQHLVLVSVDGHTVGSVSIMLDTNSGKSLSDDIFRYVFIEDKYIIVNYDLLSPKDKGVCSFDVQNVCGGQAYDLIKAGQVK